jgi:uncharacterized protein (DUF885 family)
MTDSAAHTRSLVDAYWDDLLRLDPLLATSVGDDRFDDRLPDLSEGGIRAAAGVHQRLLRQLGDIDRPPLDPVLRATADIAESIARDGVEAAALRLDRIHLIDHLLGPTGLVAYLSEVVRAQTDDQVARYAIRLGAMDGYIDTIIGEVVVARTAGIRWPRPIVERVISQVRRLLATPARASPLLSPLDAAGATARDAVETAIARSVMPAFERYLQFVERELENARDTMGLNALPEGERLYRACIRRWTSRDLEPTDLHELGRQALSEIADDRRAILADLGFRTVADALDAYHDRMRPQLRDREALLAFVRGYVDRGWDAAQPFFLRMPVSNCVVRLVEEFREPDYPGASYQPPSEGRSGSYLVNAAFYLDPGSRLLHRLASTSYHEANPGHHFQTAIEQNQVGVPPLRRFVGSFRGDAFTEGWGLYAERLADEMGLYADDYERLGRLDNEALRAVRLVVDTGLHAFGWSRDQGVDELVLAGLPRAEAEVEVDRYAVDPAQALCYKVGELDIRRLRARFAPSNDELPLFHDRLLGLGALPLDTLEKELTALYRGVHA